MRKHTALVTGASSGMGESIAVALQKEGYQVYAAARRTDKMEHLIEQGIRTISLDVTDDNSMKHVINTIEKEEKMVDVLINNAGYGSFGALEDVPISEAKRQFEVNVFGLARLSQLVIPKMRESRHGAIINISSIGGKLGEPFGSWYHASKFAVEGLTDSLALELAQFNIKVIAIEPGAIKTEWWSIAADNLLKTSGNGAYAISAKKRAESMKSSSRTSVSSPPEVVAEKIVKVLAKPNPKLRYAVGGGAVPLLFLRRITSDRIFYKILSRILD